MSILLDHWRFLKRQVRIRKDVLQNVVVEVVEI